MKLTLSKNLKILLKDHDLSVPKLSSMVGISNQTISNWLGGQKPRNLEQVKAVSDFFDITLDELCFGEDLDTAKNTIDKHCEEINAGVFEVVLRRVKK